MTEVAVGGASTGLDRLDAAQQQRIADWFGPVTVRADHTWPLQQTAVLELTTARGPVVVKASTGPAMAHHLRREIAAHRECLGALGDGFPVLLHAADDVLVLATRHLPGRIAQGTEWELDPGVHARAGALLARLHRSAAPVVSDDHESAHLAKLDRLLDRARDLLDRDVLERASVAAAGLVPSPVELVPTHGDVQPRNWLVDPAGAEGVPVTRLIDFGRYAWRPWFSDLVRLHHQVHPGRPDLRAAVLEALGVPPDWPTAAAERSSWLLENLVQSVSTVVWATEMGDLAFADQGREMVRRTLDGRAGT